MIHYSIHSLPCSALFIFYFHRKIRLSNYPPLGTTRSLFCFFHLISVHIHSYRNISVTWILSFALRAYLLLNGSRESLPLLVSPLYLKSFLSFYLLECTVSLSILLFINILFDWSARSLTYRCTDATATAATLLIRYHTKSSVRFIDSPQNLK